MRSLSARAGAMLLLATMLVTMLAGCSPFSTKLEAPDFTLVGIQMMSTDMFAQRFKLRVLVKNPNEIEIPVKGIDYKIVLMGDSFADGSTTERFVLPAHGE